VSIHAPARGATHGGSYGVKKDQVFQSTPPRGGRLHAIISMILHCLFLLFCEADIYLLRNNQKILP
ncbi:MAG: hypothetical protein JW795_04570, partial [Chitinivibrionales bacterium]|nr:hypothetical protein [Chitinivibrionales bacterium]